jgi:hypothetical protein
MAGCPQILTGVGGLKMKNIRQVRMTKARKMGDAMSHMLIRSRDSNN